MSFFKLLGAIVKKRLANDAPKPVRDIVPFRLAQTSAVEISIVPLVLAESAGALFGSQVTEKQTIVAVGRFTLFGIQYIRAYLSQDAGAYFQFAIQGHNVIETRLFRPYDEVIPATTEDWSFWLDQFDGYVGYPVMQSKDEDGPQQYRRSWAPSDQRISPFETTETIIDMAGSSTAIQHLMMLYSRGLSDRLAEYLLVSAVATDDGMSINLWLGIDLTEHDLTVYPGADVPVF